MFWYNGKSINSQTIELDINNPGLLYGATIFSTLRVYDSLDNPLTQWQAHLARIKTSLNYFNWQQPNWESIRDGAELMKQHFPVLRITVFPDGKEWITGRMLAPDLPEKQKHGITASIVQDYYRSLPGHKTGNYLAPILAKADAQNQNSQEAIFIDGEGNWLETTTGNLWGWKDNCWWTPPINAGILPGIAREYLRTSLIKQNQIVREDVWNIELVKSFKTLANSNCVVEIIPIHTVIHCTGQLTYNTEHSSLKLLQNFFHL
ncbi:aminotransferase class IV [Calothrix sp. NIES-4071]|nr:aminotransferase class IV [Calothrix sp. NIES-4071]BAZ61921.1 aminotransferase class IV [Calothrix sp. NIES-4105]